MNRVQTILLGLAMIALFLAPAVLPFPYGANRPAGALRLQLISFGILALAALGARGRGGLGHVRIPCLLTGALVGLGIVQIAPLPEGLVAALSPESLRVWNEAASVLALFDRPAPSPRISIVPWETAQQTILIAAWLALFLAVVIVGRERPRTPPVLLSSLALCGVIHAIHGTMLVRLGRDTELFGDRAHGTFINPNHFASFLNLCLAAAFALLLVEVLYLLTGHRPRRISPARVVARVFLTATAVLVIGAGVLMSQSRGGIFSAAVLLVLMTTATMFHPRVRTRRRSVIVGFVVATLIVGAGAIVISSPSTLYRFLSVDPTDPDSDARTYYWQTSIPAIEKYPLVGSGLGTFRESYRRVQPVDERGGYISHAHNDPLELLVTGGAVGFLLGLAGFLSTVWILTRAWWREAHRDQSVWILGGVAGVVAVTLHSLIEFPFTIPAIPAVLAILLGASWSAGRRHSAAEERGSLV